MMNYKNWALVIVFALIVLLCGLLLFGAPRIVKADRAGQTVEFLGHFRDDNGIAAVPDSVKFLVYVNGQPYDSSAWLTSLGNYTNFRTLQYQWLIPSLDDSSTVSCVARASGETGIVLDEFLMSPTNILLRAAMTDTFSGAWMDSVNAQLTVVAGLESGDTIHAYVDSIAPAAVADIHDVEADLLTAVIDSSDAGGIYYPGGGVVTDARVYATADSGSWGTPFYMTHSILGDYKLAVPKPATGTLTYYISAFYPGTWAKTWVPVVVGS